MVEVKFDFGKRDVFVASFLIVLLGVGFVYAYGGISPSIMGHTWKEIDFDDEFCRYVTGDDCAGGVCEDSSWSPATSTRCDGVSFIQTSNCGNTKINYGTKDCTPSEPTEPTEPSEPTESKYYASVNGERLDCSDSSKAAGWYKLKGRCGEPSGISYWNSDSSATYDSFSDIYDNICEGMGAGSISNCNDMLLCRTGDDYRANTEYCVSG